MILILEWFWMHPFQNLDPESFWLDILFLPAGRQREGIEYFYSRMKNTFRSQRQFNPKLEIINYFIATMFDLRARKHARIRSHKLNKKFIKIHKKNCQNPKMFSGITAWTKRWETISRLSRTPLAITIRRTPIDMVSINLFYFTADFKIFSIFLIIFN